MTNQSQTQMSINHAQHEIVFTRVFDAPRDLVFKVYTDPELIPLWWGPSSQTVTVEKMEVRPGGQWRYISRSDDGSQVSFYGEYREVVPPERLSYTFEFEFAPGHVSLETAVFEDLNGKTKVTATAAYQSTEQLEAVIQSGMESGARETYERMAELLQAVQNKAR
jgi:uncharacterized protein YndB with AHSA1/START domain